MKSILKIGLLINVKTSTRKLQKFIWMWNNNQKKSKKQTEKFWKIKKNKLKNNNLI